LFIFPGGSQQELTGRERRVRHKKKDDENEISGGAHKTKPHIRSSRERLSFDPPPYDKTDALKKKKQSRRRSDYGQSIFFIRPIDQCFL